ncbi:MAG: ABC transporter permease [Gemmatimonadales bacterium]
MTAAPRRACRRRRGDRGVDRAAPLGGPRWCSATPRSCTPTTCRTSHTSAARGPRAWFAPTACVIGARHLGQRGRLRWFDALIRLLPASGRGLDRGPRRSIRSATTRWSPPANYRDWQEMASSFESMAAFNTCGWFGRARPAGAGRGFWVEPTLLEVLGIPLALGRGFTAADADPGAPGTVILSEPFWRARFAADPGVLGRVIHLDGGAYEVIGVLSPALRFPRPSTQFWIPLLLPEEVYLDRGNNYLEVVATLRPGTTIEAARADLDVVTRRLAALYPDANRDTGATVERLRDQISERSRLLLLALVGASLCILIIACANLGSSLLARGSPASASSRCAPRRSRPGAAGPAAGDRGVWSSPSAGAGVLVAGLSLPLLSRLVPPQARFRRAEHRLAIGRAALLTVLFTCSFTVLPARRASLVSAVLARRAHRRAEQSGPGR